MNSPESNRQKAKRQLRDEIGSYTGKNVTKIEALPFQQEAEGNLTVAAYCRVSTDDLGQVLSIEMQKREYRKKIRENPQWTYFGTYVDDGFSGTNTAHRPGFRKMMEDAMEGKFNLIITKSVSRFARNLLDCISWVRTLQEVGVAVIFEDVNLNTLDQTSNLILFVLAMVAEEESHMKSEAMNLSLEWRFSSGRFLIPRLLGYETVKGEDGKKTLEIVPEEAGTVRLMYSMLLNGESTEEIARTLTELKRPTGSGRTEWTPDAVRAVLRNERYCGDILARKTWTPNFRDHKAKKNRGEKNRYYQPGHHEAIVGRAQWNAAQKILNSRRYGHKAGYLPVRMIPQGTLKGYISLNRFWAGADADDYYRISSVAMGLVDGDLASDLETEHLPDGGYSLLGLSDEEGIQRILRQLTEAEIELKAELDGEENSEDKGGHPVPGGFQVVRGNLFSHRYDPAFRIYRNKIRFNTACIQRMSSKQETVEMLINPVERMILVRPCDPSEKNAIHWCDKNGRGKSLGAAAFCKMIYSLMVWEEDFSYRLPAIVKNCGTDTVLFFDLDHSVGTMTVREEPSAENQKDVSEETPVQEAPNGKAYFYSADDETADEPQEIEEIAVLEKKLKQAQELERRTFGEPAFDHDLDFRLPPPDENGQWDLMAQAVPLSDNYGVEKEVIENMQRKMMRQAKQFEDEPFPVESYKNEQIYTETIVVD